MGLYITMANTANKYTPARAKAQKRRYEKKTDEVKFQMALSQARGYVKWFADDEDMYDLRRYYRIPLYKAPYGSRPLLDKRIGPYRSNARKIAQFARDNNQPELYQELVNLYNEYKNKRDNVREL